MNYSNVKTETALLDTVEKSINTTAFIVRDETFVNSDLSGTVVPLVNDGQRVAKGEEVAAVFSSEQEANNFIRKNELKNEIERYDKTTASERLNITDIENFDHTLNSTFSTMIDAIYDEDYISVDKISKIVLDDLTARQTALGIDVDYSKIYNVLKTEYDSIITENPEIIQASTTGYYINSIDGYEGKIDYDNVDNLSPFEVKTAIENKDMVMPEKAIGKLVDNFNWYMLCVVERKDIGNLVVGSTAKVRFSNAAISELDVTVSAINVQDNKNVALTLKSNLVSEKYSTLRCEDIEIITRKISGYRVSKDAIHTLDGINGVYVLEGNIIAFRRITVLHTKPDYVIVRSSDDEEKSIVENADIISTTNEKDLKERYLRQREETPRILDLETDYSFSAALSKKYIQHYDEVIVEGRDLYDNKLVR